MPRGDRYVNEPGLPEAISLIEDELDGTAPAPPALTNLQQSINAKEDRIDRTNDVLGYVVTRTADGLSLRPSGLEEPIRVSGVVNPTPDQANGFFIFEAGGDFVIPSDEQVNMPIGASFAVAALDGPVGIYTTANAPADISLVGSTAFATASAGKTSHDIPVPPCAAGDGLLLLIATATTSSTYTYNGPADFLSAGVHFGPSGAGHHLFYKSNAAATDSETTKNFSVGGSTNAPITAVMAAFRGVDNANMLGQYVTTGTANTDVSPSATTEKDKAVHIITKNYGGGTNVRNYSPNPPVEMTKINGNFTSLTEANTTVAMAWDPAPKPLGSVLPTRTWTEGGYGGAATITLNPAEKAALTFINQDGLTSWVINKGERAFITKTGPNEYLVTA